MREPNSIYATRRRAVRLWLWSVAALIFAMVLVGGATRLTESGLSITEWQPVTGTIPPPSHDAWQAEFDKYKTIPQYQKMNRGMSLAEFKTIFWWEWTHRLLARLIGAAFLLPFVFFLWRGWAEPGLRSGLWAIFALLAVEPVAGWWMVASGLAERTEVSQYRLAFHLTLACVIYVAIVWTAERLAPRPAVAVAPRLRVTAIALLALVLAQIYLGALTAGLRAGLAYNTWPLIDGALVPSSAHLFFDQPLWRNLFENILTVQFEHRMMAYTVLLVALLHAGDAIWIKGWVRFASGAIVLSLAVMFQAALGILTLLHQVPIGLALAHQGMALVVLTIASLHAAHSASGLTLPPIPAPDRR